MTAKTKTAIVINSSLPTENVKGAHCANITNIMEVIIKDAVNEALLLIGITHSLNVLKIKQGLTLFIELTPSILPLAFYYLTATF
jgi:hypothetical protein